MEFGTVFFKFISLFANYISMLKKIGYTKSVWNDSVDSTFILFKNL